MSLETYSTLVTSICLNKPDGLEIWAPTQSPDMAQVAAAKATDYSLDDITIHTTFIDGGFGRRINQDFVAEAAAISEISQQPPIKTSSDFTSLFSTSTFLMVCMRVRLSFGSSV